MSSFLLALADELCAAAPTVLVIDDLQWADDASLLVWHQLAASIDQLRLLLIATCRPAPRRTEVQQVRASLARRGGAVVELGPLPKPTWPPWSRRCSARHPAVDCAS